MHRHLLPPPNTTNCSLPEGQNLEYSEARVAFADQLERRGTEDKQSRKEHPVLTQHGMHRIPMQLIGPSIVLKEISELVWSGLPMAAPLWCEDCNLTMMKAAQLQASQQHGHCSAILPHILHFSMTYKPKDSQDSQSHMQPIKKRSKEQLRAKEIKRAKGEDGDILSGV